MEEWKKNKFLIDDYITNPMDLLRKRRDELLINSDWIGLNDCRLSEEMKQKYILYRQALRDMTNTSAPRFNDDTTFLEGVNMPIHPNDNEPVIIRIYTDDTPRVFLLNEYLNQ